MKRVILLSVAAMMSVAAYSQTNQSAKTDTAKKIKPAAKPEEKKPEFNVDWSKSFVVHADFVIPASLINDYIINEQRGEAIDDANDLSAHQAKVIKQNHKRVIDSLTTALYRNYQEFEKKQRIKFTADTTARRDSLLKASLKK